MREVSKLSTKDTFLDRVLGQRRLRRRGLESSTERCLISSHAQLSMNNQGGYPSYWRARNSRIPLARLDAERFEAKNLCCSAGFPPFRVSIRPDPTPTRGFEDFWGFNLRRLGCQASTFTSPDSLSLSNSRTLAGRSRVEAIQKPALRIASRLSDSARAWVRSTLETILTRKLDK